MPGQDQTDRTGLRVFRFAPSPNGPLHLGHALSALVNADRAEASGGRLLLRIEDIDTARCRPEFEDAIYTDLEWLGLRWIRPVKRQSDHFAAYRNALDHLISAGLVYPAFASRAEIAAEVDRRQRAAGAPWPRDPDGAPLYPFDDRDLAPARAAERIARGDQYALRLDMKKALRQVTKPLTWRETGAGPHGKTGTITARPQDWGDVVLARKDTPTSYHLAVVVDDAADGVSDVVRGRDLFWSTSVHRLLQVLLGLAEPIYHHHRLILAADGRKLSKSAGDTGLAALREKGMTPADIRALIGIS